MLHFLPIITDDEISRLTINKAENLITELDKLLTFTLKINFPDWLLFILILLILLLCFIDAKNIKNKICTVNWIIYIVRFSLTTIVLLTIITFYGDIYTGSVLDPKNRIIINMETAKLNKEQIGIATKKRVEKIKKEAITRMIESTFHNKEINRLKNANDALNEILEKAQHTEDLKNNLDDISFQIILPQIILKRKAMDRIIKNCQYKELRNIFKAYSKSDSKKSEQKWNIKNISNADVQIGKDLNLTEIETLLNTLEEEIKILDELIKNNKSKLNIISNSEQIVSKIIALINSQTTKKAIGNGLLSFGVTGDLLNVLLDALLHDNFEKYLSDKILKYIDPHKRINLSSYTHKLQETVDAILKKIVITYPVDDRLKVYFEVFEKIKKVSYDLDVNIDKVCKPIYFRMKNDFECKLKEKAKSLYLSDDFFERFIDNLNKSTNNTDLSFRKKLNVLNRLVNIFNNNIEYIKVKKKIKSYDFTPVIISNNENNDIAKFIRTKFEALDLEIKIQSKLLELKTIEEKSKKIKKIYEDIDSFRKILEELDGKDFDVELEIYRYRKLLKELNLELEMNRFRKYLKKQNIEKGPFLELEMNRFRKYLKKQNIKNKLNLDWKSNNKPINIIEKFYTNTFLEWKKNGHKLNEFSLKNTEKNPFLEWKKNGYKFNEFPLKYFFKNFYRTR